MNTELEKKTLDKGDVVVEQEKNRKRKWLYVHSLDSEFVSLKGSSRIEFDEMMWGKTEDEIKEIIREKFDDRKAHDIRIVKNPEIKITY